VLAVLPVAVLRGIFFLALEAFDLDPDGVAGAFLEFHE
jgi:hypothetical protein